MEDLMQQGKRDLACGEYTKAVQSFQTTCETLSKDHENSASHLAEPYYYYGCALLEVSRMESDVLGNALEGVPEGEETEQDNIVEEDEKPLTDEEKEKLSEEVIDAMCTDDKPDDVTGGDEKPEIVQDDTPANGESEEKINEQKDGDVDKESPENGDAAVEEKGDKDGEENAKNGSNDVVDETSNKDEENAEEDSNDDAEDSNDEGGDDDEESEDDVSSLQLAWEVLELSKKYFTELGDSNENKLRVSDCLFKLGEIGLEKEDYEQSISDFSECLEVRKSVLSDNDRLLAEVHFQLGVANGANSAYAQAISEFELCKQVLERRIQSLDSKKEEADLSEEEKDKIESEITQIKGLVPEINQRISEANEDRFDYDQIKKTVREGFASVTKVISSFSDASAAEGADDISHLVRKKRKAEDESSADSNGAANGHSGLNGNSETTVANGDLKNGHNTESDVHSPVTKKVKVSDEQDTSNSKANEGGVAPTEVA